MQVLLILKMVIQSQAPSEQTICPAGNMSKQWHWMLPTLSVTTIPWIRMTATDDITVACQSGRCTKTTTDDITTACQSGRCTKTATDDITVACQLRRCTKTTTDDITKACQSRQCTNTSQGVSGAIRGQPGGTHPVPLAMP